ENSWSNPAFVQRFIGSYGFDTTATPSITSEEKALFEQVAPLMQAKPLEAAAIIEAALKPESSGALDYTLGNIYFQTGDISRASKYYEQAVRKFPTFVRAYKNIGLIKIQQNDPKGALPFLLKAIETGGGDGDLYGLVGFCYLSSGKSARALSAYEMALLFAPQSRDWRLGAVQAMINLQKNREAIDMLDELITEAEGDVS